MKKKSIPDISIKPFTRATEIPVLSFTLANQIRTLTAQERWEEVRAAANLGLGIAQRALRFLRVDCRESFSREAQMRKSNQELKKYLMSLKTKEQRKAFFSKLKARISKKKQPSDKSLLKTLNKLLSGKMKLASFIKQIDKAEKSEGSLFFNPAGDAAVALGVKSLMAFIQAEFNLNHYRLLALEKNNPEYTVRHSNLKQLTPVFSRTLRTEQRNLYSRAVNMDASGLGRAAFQLAGVIEESLPQLVREQAKHRILLRNLLPIQKKAQWKTETQLALVAGDTVREAMTCYAAAYALVLETARVENSNYRSDLLSKAKSRPFTGKVPDGKNVELKDLSKTRDGKYVEIHGLVLGTKTGRSRDKKLISQVYLLDPISKTTATAVAVYAHLGHLGIARGTYCKLSGVYQSKSRLVGRKPAVEIQKLKINDLAKKSWQVALWDLADKWYYRWPAGLNLQASQAPHRRKRKAKEHNYEGAGEVVYQPLVRQ